MKLILILTKKRKQKIVRKVKNMSYKKKDVDLSKISSNINKSAINNEIMHNDIETIKKDDNNEKEMTEDEKNTSNIVDCKKELKDFKKKAKKSNMMKSDIDRNEMHKEDEVADLALIPEQNFIFHENARVNKKRFKEQSIKELPQSINKTIEINVIDKNRPKSTQQNNSRCKKHKIPEQSIKKQIYIKDQAMLVNRSCSDISQSNFKDTYASNKNYETVPKEFRREIEKKMDGENSSLVENVDDLVSLEGRRNSLKYNIKDGLNIVDHQIEQNEPSRNWNILEYKSAEVTSSKINTNNIKNNNTSDNEINLECKNDILDSNIKNDIKEIVDNTIFCNSTISKTIVNNMNNITTMKGEKSSFKMQKEVKDARRRFKKRNHINNIKITPRLLISYLCTKNLNEKILLECCKYIDQIEFTDDFINDINCDIENFDIERKNIDNNILTNMDSGTCFSDYSDVLESIKQNINKNINPLLNSFFLIKHKQCLSFLDNILDSFKIQSNFILPKIIDRMYYIINCEDVYLCEKVFHKTFSIILKNKNQHNILKFNIDKPNDSINNGCDDFTNNNTDHNNNNNINERLIFTKEVKEIQLKILLLYSKICINIHEKVFKVLILNNDDILDFKYQKIPFNIYIILFLFYNIVTKDNVKEIVSLINSFTDNFDNQIIPFCNENYDNILCRVFYDCYIFISENKDVENVLKQNIIDFNIKSTIPTDPEKNILNHISNTMNNKPNCNNNINTNTEANIKNTNNIINNTNTSINDINNKMLMEKYGEIIAIQKNSILNNKKTIKRRKKGKKNSMSLDVRNMYKKKLKSSQEYKKKRIKGKISGNEENSDRLLKHRKIMIKLSKSTDVENNINTISKENKITNIISNNNEKTYMNKFIDDKQFKRYSDTINDLNTSFINSKKKSRVFTPVNASSGNINVCQNKTEIINAENIGLVSRPHIENKIEACIFIYTTVLGVTHIEFLRRIYFNIFNSIQKRDFSGLKSLRKFNILILDDKEKANLIFCLVNILKNINSIKSTNTQKNINNDEYDNNKTDKKKDHKKKVR
ncbi:hypothetical protein EDEG_00270 [Edhazardia aedis USNM 41457]|uniref:Uncharacterized protein n=1 Tax=Edhazardia aedis (strain USNM 41457) TaxID=1003232 RepID=J9D471_EDHAE|nr:hypothetical protein EDEG_00270 [Edhazardia aedis USNM 41457]|eukprot:EJW02576.1 hypothetical protein EDEG_00270 [Edhazardia aedis USNM 41457]